MVTGQPTSFCNLDCSYCYLPLRKQKLEMSVDTAARIAESVDAQRGVERVSMVWHGGEPTSIGVEKFLALMEPFEGLRKAGRMRHSIQTNATLVDDRWVELFREYDFAVSLSIDGTAEMTAQRVNLAGRPMHDKILQGFHRLRDGGLDPYAICVVTAENIDRPEELMDFIAGLGIRQVGLNIEEIEGVNTARPVIGKEQARVWWGRALRHYLDRGYRFNIRELGFLGTWMAGHKPKYRNPMPTVSHDGNVVLLSPELAGIKSDVHNDFIVGNVNDELIGSMLARRGDIPYVQEFERGMAECRRTCGYWDLCLGGYASNRHAQFGRLDVTENNHCLVSRQGLVLGLIDASDPVQDADLIGRLTELTIPKGVTV